MSAYANSFEYNEPTQAGLVSIGVVLTVSVKSFVSQLGAEAVSMVENQNLK